ncbi:MAG: hypothetical protein QW429_02185 [Thermoprotei archaeon]
MLIVKDLNDAYNRVASVLRGVHKNSRSANSNVDSDVSQMVFDFSIWCLKRLRMGYTLDPELVKSALIVCLAKRRVYWVDVNKMVRDVYNVLKGYDQNLRSVLAYCALKSKISDFSL